MAVNTRPGADFYKVGLSDPVLCQLFYVGGMHATNEVGGGNI